MIVNIKTYTDLRRRIGKEIIRIEMNERVPVQQLFRILIDTYGTGVKQMIYGKRVAILLNGKNIELLEGLKTSLDHEDIVTILPVVSGG